MGFREWLSGDPRKKGVPESFETGDSEPKQPEKGAQMSPEDERQAVNDLEREGMEKTGVDEMEAEGVESQKGE